ncbi:MAG: UDP-N-acetylmuramoylalanyl-D-glutamate--2,6-diaminopimelate ligase, partial [Flavisolibacter sp.]|nr:UDP-N-acetylmuramoylalanyl-D-glutamate--2,6-diaminopimelate ligase [Flavisolibacter sp.]
DTQLVGSYNLPNVLAAAAVGLFFNVAEEKIVTAISAYTPSNSRSQLLQKGDNKIILDAYNANPTSMKLAIENFARLPENNKTLILGAMAELGVDSIKEHEAIVTQIQQYPWRQVLLVGGDFLKLQPSFPTFPSTTEAGNWLQQQQVHDSYVLIKGSRSMQMEKILNYL